MRDKLLIFLKALESRIPPPPYCHHALTYAQYGSDEAGWEEKLALQINAGGKFHCFFIEPGDFEKGDGLIAEIAEGLAKDMPNAQISETALRYHP